MSTTTTVDPSNAAQLAAWDGEEGAYWAAHADRYDRSVAPLHRRLLAEAAIAPGERVLDIGCGTGQTTRDAARASGNGEALGVDLSAGMLDVARDRASAEGVANATFVQADAQVHPFEAGSFDVAVSRTGAMFFGDPAAAFANVGSAMRPGGRLVMATWASLADNEWMREIAGALAAGRDLPTPPPDAPGPFSLSDEGHVRSLLGGAGFVDVELERASSPMWFGHDADDASTFILGQLGWLLAGLDDDGRARALDALHASTAAHEGADGVTYGSTCWAVRAVRP
ncbi:MAG TPA: methyltransferase domain-containing protein [Aquihabitans sp.]|jgi:SAM-dependent methyltransferase|nr:methyltransferase domain-containing protein [Aquihabitans sp.]